MTPILSFRLKLRGTDRFDGLQAESTSFRVHGLLRLEGDALVIQWGGTVQIQDFGLFTFRDEQEVLSDESVVVPVRDLYRALAVGGWWRPRLMIQAKELGALAAVPGEEHGTVQFWCARRDRPIATSMAAAINAAIAAAPLRRLGGDVSSEEDTPVSTPPRGLAEP